MDFKGNKPSLFPPSYIICQLTPMSKDNPISILDEDQKMDEIRKQVNKSALIQASMSSRFDVIITVLKLDMNCSEEEKDKRIRNRIQKFFDYGEKKIDLSRHEHFFDRRDIGESQTELIGNELVLFGVDFLNSKRIKSMFTTSDLQIRWLDDSHCKLIFNSADAAKQAIASNVKNPEILQVKMEEESMQVPRSWFELRPYYEMGFERKLLCRYATNDEEKRVTHSKNFQLFKEARRKFEEDMAKEIQNSFNRHVLNLGLQDMFTRGRNRDSGRVRNERGRSRSREKRPRRNDNYEDYGRDNRRSNFGEGRFNRDNFNNRDDRGGWENRDFRRKGRREGQDDESLNVSIERRPRKERKLSFSQSGSGSEHIDENGDRVSNNNFSFILEQEPNDIVDEFDRMDIDEKQFSEIGKQEQYNNESAIIENQNLSYEIGEANNMSRLSDHHNLSYQLDLNNSIMSNRTKREKPNNLSFSYLDYTEQQEKLEKQKKQKKDSQIELVVIDDN